LKHIFFESVVLEVAIKKHNNHFRAVEIKILGSKIDDTIEIKVAFI
jgi:hypothetical protein